MHRARSAPSTLYSRRRFLALAGTGAATAVVGPAALLGQPPTADAFESWCFDDPVIDINGRRVQIVIGIQGDQALVDKYVQQAVTVVGVPIGASARTVLVTKENFKESVTYTSTGTPWRAGQPNLVPITISFKQKLPTSLPAKATITYPGGTITLLSTTAGVMKTTLSLL